MANSPFKFFNKNSLGRDYVVGDLHGMFSVLESLLERLDFNPRVDRVFSVGDLIDRGPESYRVLEFLDKPWFFSIKGNHESMLINAREDKSIYRSWTKHNGGAWWESINSATQDEIYQRLKQLPLIFEIACDTGHIGVAHADVPVGITWEEVIQNIYSDEEIQNYVMWSRNRYKYIQLTKETIAVDGVDLVVMGHTPIAKPLHIENLFYIDTGAAFIDNEELGYLTLLQIHPTIELHQYPEPLN